MPREKETDTYVLIRRPCAACDGTGKSEDAGWKGPCATCMGKGLVEKWITLANLAVLLNTAK